jgi:hypothetical protein
MRFWLFWVRFKKMLLQGNSNKKGESLCGFALLFLLAEKNYLSAALTFHLLQLFSFGFFDVPHNKKYREEREEGVDTVSARQANRRCQ